MDGNNISLNMIRNLESIQHVENTAILNPITPKEKHLQALFIAPNTLHTTG